MATATRRRHARIGPRSAGLTMTASEFDRIPYWACQKGYRYELIRGVLVVTPVAGNGELDPNEDLGFLLRHHQEFHPQGRTIDLTLNEQTLLIGEDRRRCDRAIWVGLGRLPDPAVDFPNIVIEFVSQSRRDFLRDYEVKRDEYRRAGAQEYWIIDRFRRMMTVYRFAQGAETSESVRTVAATESYQTDLLPGFVLPLDRILARADRWKRPPRPRRARPRPPEPDPKPVPPEGDSR